MARRFVPVIGTNAKTGEKVRFDSVNAAAEWLGVHAAQISNALVIGYNLHGYHWEKEGDSNAAD